jgi:hypothetical protein
VSPAASIGNPNFRIDILSSIDFLNGANLETQ